MSKLMSLDKQVEQKAKKWFIDSQSPENRILAKRFFEENKKEIKDEYLEKHPKVEKEYKEKKKLLLKVKIALATTGALSPKGIETEPPFWGAGRHDVNKSWNLFTFKQLSTS